MNKKIQLILGVTMLGGMLASCGGNKEFDSSKNISVLVRETGSGTRGAFLEILGLKGAADPTGAIVQTSTSAILTEVSGNNYAIAYDSLGYVDDSVKILKVDNVAPSAATVKNGTYAISRPLNVIYKEAIINSEPVYQDYLAFLGSKEAEKMASDEGYVAIHDSTTSYTKTADYAGKKITISGSTSLQPLMVKLAAKYNEYHSEVTIEVAGGGSGTGYSNAENGTSVFGMISEEFNSTKAASCTPYTVCKDGIAVIVNKKNTLDSISKTDLATIYNPKAETPITTWSQLIK